MIKHYLRYIKGYGDRLCSYYSCLDRLSREIDYISLDRSNGVCPYKDTYPYCYKRDLKVNMVFESTKIRSWEI